MPGNVHSRVLRCAHRLIIHQKADKSSVEDADNSPLVVIRYSTCDLNSKSETIAQQQTNAHTLSQLLLYNVCLTLIRSV